jgi:RimJ/RimL family protein N-acetyltransferase
VNNSSDRVTLRPYRADEFEQARLIREITDPEAIEKFRERFISSGLWLGHFLHLAIDMGGTLVGDVQLRHCDASMPSGALEMGLEVSSELRGKGIGTQALREIATYAFNAGHHRIEGSTAQNNLAMRKAFEKAGWKFEGVLRALFVEDGKPIDYYSFATTRYDESDGSVA